MQTPNFTRIIWVLSGQSFSLLGFENALKYGGEKILLFLVQLYIRTRVKRGDMETWINHSIHFVTVDLAFEFYFPFNELSVIIQDWIVLFILPASSPT